MCELRYGARAVARSGRLWFLGVLVACVGALHALLPGAVDAQARDSAAGGDARAAAPDTVRRNLPAARSVTGRVVRPAGRATRGVPNVWVVLHRVGSDSAAPLDSMRSRSDGGFTFRYRASGDADAIYFVSADYGGIAYFSPPLRDAAVRGGDADITVFDTTSGPIPLRVRGKHVAVSSPRSDGHREIVEVYELSNDSTVTLISPDGVRPTWSVAVPEDARDFQAGQGDISADAIALRQGRVLVVAPFAPGLKQLSFAYRMPSAAFPLSIALGSEVGTLEVLLEEPAARAEGVGLKEVEPVTAEGRSFRRFLAQDAPASGVIRITTPAASPVGRRRLFFAVLAVAIGAAMLVALATSFKRRARAAAVPSLRTPPRDDPGRLMRAIAELDDSFRAVPERGAAERSAYEEERASLKQRLADALAARKHAE